MVAVSLTPFLLGSLGILGQNPAIFSLLALIRFLA